MGKAFDFLANTEDAVCVIDRMQRIVLWNDAAERLLGRSSEETLGQPCYSVLAGRRGPGCPVCEENCAAQRAVARTELVQTRDVQFRTKAGEWICLNVTTIAFPSSWHELSVLAHLMRDTRAGLLEAHPQVTGPQKKSGVVPPLPRLDNLSPRETEVLRLLARGFSTEAMVQRLAIRRTTVRTHVQHVLEKLGVHSRLEAVTRGQRHGLL